jgi:hypothetical protein
MQAAVGKPQSAVGSVKSAREGAQAQRKAGTQSAALVPYCGAPLVRMADVAKTDGSSHASVTVSGGYPPRGKAVISGDYKRIKIGKRSINLSSKFKARSFFRFVHGQVKNSDGLFYVEEMRDAFNSQFGEKRARSGWRSERLKEDLFKGLGEGDFEFLFALVGRVRRDISDLRRYPVAPTALFGLSLKQFGVRSSSLKNDSAVFEFV